MAVDFFLKKDDTSPPIVGVLKDATGSIVDLTGTTVRFIMTNKATGALVVDSPCDVTDAIGGQVAYQWQTGDSETVGTYRAEIEVKWPDTTVETFPNSSYITIKIVADLGGVV